MKFTSDRENFHFEMYILLSLLLFGPYGRGEKMGKNVIINHLIPFDGL